MESTSVAKYNRQNSNNAQIELSNTPMLQKHVSIVEPPKFEKQISIREPHRYLRQISRNTSVMMKCVFLVSILLNVITIPALTAVLTIMFQQSCPWTPPTPGAPDLMCYPCGDDGIPGVPDTQKTQNGYCCASKRDGNLKRLIERNILPSASAMVQKSRPCLSDLPKKTFSPKTIAHLLVKVKKTKSDQTIHWQSESSTGTAFLMGDLQISGSAIRVKKGGLYRVKSHFSFDSVRNKGCNGTVLFDHSIHKRSKTGGMITLKLVKTMLLKQQYVSSDVDLNVKLREGDMIFVALHTFRFLYDLDIANTFDIEKID